MDKQYIAINNHKRSLVKVGQINSLAPDCTQQRRDEKPFADNLEYLDALEKETLLILIKAFMRDKKRDLHNDIKQRKILSLIGLSDNPLKEQSWDDMLRDIQHQNRSRELASFQSGVKLFLPSFCKKNGLDDFNKDIVLLLLMSSTSDKCREMLLIGEHEDDPHRSKGMRIETILSLLCQDYRQQLLYRKYFSVNAPLMSKGIVCLDCFNENTSSIFEQIIILNERYVRYLIGDNNLYSQSFKYIKRERSTISINQVVMPGNEKEKLVLHIGKYLRERNNGELTRLDKFYGYGTALSLFFHGPSGTGKTMMANALASHFKSDLLIVRFKNNDPCDYSEVIDNAFQEAALNKGFIFFDEADDLFQDGTYLSRILLMKLENARCVVILATNKPFELDPAMERRLSMKIYFPIPDINQRLNLWHALMPNFVSLAPEVDIQYLADRYIFSGGLIKNCIFLAINAASKGDDSPIILTQEELIYAADSQSGVISDVRDFCRSYKPLQGINTLPLSRQRQNEIKNIAKVYQQLQEEGLGLNILISTSHLETGIDAAEALAHECKLIVNSYNYNAVLNTEKESLIIDPITHQKIKRMDYAFKKIPGDSSLTLFVDYERVIEWNSNYEKRIQEKTGVLLAPHASLQNNLRLHNGLFCIVVHQGQFDKPPVEFHFHLNLEYPPEEIQMQYWEHKLAPVLVNDADLAELVEQYPMHIEEIDFIMRRASIQSVIEGNSRQPSLDTVKSVVLG